MRTNQSTIILYVLCGCAGAGKTTLSKKISKEYNAIRYSFDEKQCKGYEDLMPYIQQSLNTNSVVVDALYERIDKRTYLLNELKGIPCKKVLIYVDKPLETCLAQNAQRENPLPTFVINGIYNRFQPPTLDEGWDEIITIN